MSLDATQRSAFNRQIVKMREEGFFLPAKRSLAGNDRYLIIGCGGTGAAALLDVKKAFETTLPQDQLAERVRFLVIDTDRETQKSTKEIRYPDGTCEMVEIDSLSGEQFLHLSAVQARMALEMDEDMTQWFSPYLRERLRHDCALMDGNGASGIRQIGRLHLYGNAHVVINRIRSLAVQLTNGNTHPLQVFFLTGISGGTGSGLVIDLPYLIRDALETMPGFGGLGRVTCSGFILLPPIGDSTRLEAIKRGNCNGYAALKEIEYYMTLEQRSERYSFTYPAHITVTAGRNLFDACYLLDGSMGDVAFSNPRAEACRQLSQSLLDMVTSGVTNFGVKMPTAAFLPAAGLPLMQLVANNSVKAAPRDAAYVFSALGRNELALPRHEIKAYVAERIYSKIHYVLRKYESVEEKQVKEFLQNVLKNGVKTRSTTIKSMNAETAFWYEEIGAGKGGPYFAANLLWEVAEEARLQRTKLRIARICMASDEELDNIEQYAVSLKRNVFDGYIAAMDGLRDLMKDQSCKVVRATPNGNFYSFIPQNLAQDPGTASVIHYLDGLISGNSVRKLCDALLQEMFEKHAAWNALVKDEDPTLAAKTMREFWNAQLDSLIDASFEDLLLKYYTRDPSARYSPDNQAQSRHCLEAAARGIYTHLMHRQNIAAPMARLTMTGLQSTDFVRHDILVVPETAPNLYQELRRVIAGSPLQVEVHMGSASDRICYYRYFTGIPAFKLDWACGAEADYERDLVSIAGFGCHISESAGGVRWQNMPNLMPRNTWHLMPGFLYSNPRELAIAEGAARLFDRAFDLKLTTVIANPVGIAGPIYSVSVLPVQYRPKDELFRKLDHCVEGSYEMSQTLTAIDAEAEQCAAQLFRMIENLAAASGDQSVSQILTESGVSFLQRQLAFPGSVLIPGPMDAVQDDWYEYMAKCMLRRMPDVMNEVNGTVRVMEKVVAKVNEAFLKNIPLIRFAHYLATGLFRFNAEQDTWQYLDRDEIPKVLVTLTGRHDAMVQYYLLFNAFCKNADAIAEDLKEQLKAVAPIVERDELCEGYEEKEAAFEAAVTKLLDELNVWNQDSATNSSIEVLERQGYEIKKFYHELYIEVKKLKILGFLQPMFFPE